jgi:hypothetical protein
MQRAGSGAGGGCNRTPRTHGIQARMVVNPPSAAMPYWLSRTPHCRERAIAAHGSTDFGAGTNGRARSRSPPARLARVRAVQYWGSVVQRLAALDDAKGRLR